MIKRKRRRNPSPRSYTNAYDGIFVKGSKAACLPLMNVTEYATRRNCTFSLALFVHFRLTFTILFSCVLFKQKVHREAVFLFDYPEFYGVIC